MIPKTIIEKEITALSVSHKPVMEKMQGRAERDIFLKWTVLSRGNSTVWNVPTLGSLMRKKHSAKLYKLYSMQGKLKIQQYNQVHLKEIEYWAVLDVCAGFQVVRIICSHKNMKKNFMPTYFHKEVMQHWINSKGEVRTFSLVTNVFLNTYDAWQYYSPLEIRPKNFESSPKYRINPFKVYSSAKALGVLKRNGFRDRFYGIAP